MSKRFFILLMAALVMSFTVTGCDDFLNALLGDGTEEEEPGDGGGTQPGDGGGNSGGSTSGAQVSATKIDMVWIDAGTFLLGSPRDDDHPWAWIDEELKKVVLTKGFYIGKYEVTQAQYKAVMGNNASSFCADGYYADKVKGMNTDNFPVDGATWYNAIEFCNALSVKEGLDPYYTIDKNNLDPNQIGPSPGWDWWVTVNPSANGYRLPTESQWEYACRTPPDPVIVDNRWVWELLLFHWGDVADPSKANYNASIVDQYFINPVEKPSLERTAAVGSYPPNKWGLYDMHGNVREWCWDWLSARTNTDGNWMLGYSLENYDPMGANGGRARIQRGGSWSTSARDMRCTDRGSVWYWPGAIGGEDIGFRVVKPGPGPNGEE